MRANFTRLTLPLNIHRCSTGDINYYVSTNGGCDGSLLPFIVRPSVHELNRKKINLWMIYRVTTVSAVRFVTFPSPSPSVIDWLFNEPNKYSGDQTILYFYTRTEIPTVLTANNSALYNDVRPRVYAWLSQFGSDSKNSGRPYYFDTYVWTNGPGKCSVARENRGSDLNRVSG